jgi:hypothetical protein
VSRDDVEHLLAVLHAASGGEPLPKHDFLAGVMHRGPKDEAPTAARLFQRPARECARHVVNVLLRVSAVDAEGVKLEELARIVLVETAGTVGRIADC